MCEQAAGYQLFSGRIIFLHSSESYCVSVQPYFRIVLGDHTPPAENLRNTLKVDTKQLYTIRKELGSTSNFIKAILRRKRLSYGCWSS